MPESFLPGGEKMKHIPLAVGAVLVATIGHAFVPSTETFLPSVAHGQGQCPGGVCARWRSDSWVFNPGAVAATVQISFLRRDTANTSPPSESIAVAAGETRELADVVFSLFGLDGAYGALRFSSATPVVVTGQVYDANVTTNKGTGTAGQFFAGQAGAAALGAGESVDLIGLAQDAGGLWRSNFGFLETTGASATVQVKRLGGDGVELAAKSYSVRGLEAKQFAVTDLGGPLGTNQRLHLLVTGGGGKIVAFASRIDNRSGDPSTVVGVDPATQAFLPSVGHGQGQCPGGICAQWRSDAWVFNPGAGPAAVQITYLRRDSVNTAAPSRSIVVAPGETRELADIVLSLFGLDESYGALRFSSSVPVAVTGQVYDENVVTSKGAGTAGQFFAGQPAAVAVAAGESADLVGLAQDAGNVWRSSFGFVETTGASATVEVQKIAADGVVLASKSYTVQGSEARQLAFSDLVGELGENRRLRVRVVAGAGKIIAFGSRIDNRTGDPSTVEATTAASALGESADFAEASTTPHRRLRRGAPGPTIITSSLPGATAGVAYGPVTMQVSGGLPPYTWAIVGGVEPGPSFLSAAGVLSGQISVPGTFPMEIEVSDGRGLKARRTLTLVVAAPPSFLSTGSSTLPTGEHWYGDFTVRAGHTVSVAGVAAQVSALAVTTPTVLNITGMLRVEAGGLLQVPGCSELRLNLLSRTAQPEILGEIKNTCASPGTAGGDLVIRTTGSLAVGGTGARARISSSGNVYLSDPWYQPRSSSEMLHFEATGGGEPAPPVCALRADPLTAGTPLGSYPVVVTFTAIHKDPDGGATLVVAVDYGDGTVVTNPAALQHSYAGAGLYQVMVTVEDDEGERSTASLTLALAPAAEPPEGSAAAAAATPPSLWAAPASFNAADLIRPVGVVFSLASTRQPADQTAAFESDEWSVACAAGTESCTATRGFETAGVHTVSLVGRAASGDASAATMTVFVPLAGGRRSQADPPAAPQPFPPLPPSWTAPGVGALSHATQCGDCTLCDTAAQPGQSIVVLGAADVTGWGSSGLIVIGFQSASVVVRPTFVFVATPGADGGACVSGKSGRGFGIATRTGKVVLCGGTYMGAPGGRGGDCTKPVCNGASTAGRGAGWFGILLEALAGSVSFCSAPAGLFPNRGPMTVIGASAGDGGDAVATSQAKGACENACGATAKGGRGGTATAGIAILSASVCYDRDYQLAFQSAGAVGAPAPATGGLGGDADAWGGNAAACPECDRYGGTGGSALAFAGRGGSATWYLLARDSKGPLPAETAGHIVATGSWIGGKGGDASATAGVGGAATCIGCDELALGGNGGFALAEGGKGGHGLDASGAGGDASSIGNDGGAATATGLPGGACADGCGITAVAGRGGNASATEGKHGGFGAADGAADATGGAGGIATATGGAGGDCAACPAGAGGDGGDAGSVGGNGGAARGTGVNSGGNGGAANATGALGGAGADCCQKGNDQPGGHGGKGGEATSFAGRAGQPGGAVGGNAVAAGNGGPGGDGEAPGQGGDKGTGTGDPVDIPDGVKGPDGNHCPKPLAILIYHCSIPDGTITTGADITLGAYLEDKVTPAGSVVAHFKTQEEFGGNPVSYQKSGEYVYLMGGMRWRLEKLPNQPITGAEVTIEHVCSVTGCARLFGFYQGQQLTVVDNQQTGHQQMAELFKLPPPPAGVPTYDEVVAVCYTTCRIHHWNVKVIDP